MAQQPDDPSRAAVKKFGVMVDEFSHLAGASDFIVSFVDGLVRASGTREVALIVRGPKEGWLPGLRRLFGAGLPKLPAFNVPHHAGALDKLCRDTGIDVIGPVHAVPEPAFTFPCVGFIYDFQHVHLPQYFTPQMIAERDNSFRAALQRAPAIVVHSEDVKRDAEAFLPSMKAKIFILPLAAAPPPEWLTADPAAAQAKYGIGSEYFLVSNQFWIHKRHETAIEAFAKVAPGHPGLRLVLTGATDDSRVPTRLQDLKDLIARLGVGDRIHILGLIPKLDQIAIMRGARALIQPTAFEGSPGSLATYDAIALGVPTIISDISVNCEIADHVTMYFPLDDATALADRMERLLETPRTAKSAETLLSEGDARRLRFGEEIWAAAEYAARHAPADHSG